MARYQVKYARGKAHIAGLDDKPRSGEFNYSLSACAALSKSVFWAIAIDTDDLAKALETAKHRGTGVCAKCLKTAEAALAS